MRNQSYSFSGDGRELIIHTPQLPRSWCNYISGENYGIKFSQTGGGFSIYPILEGRRLTKYGDNDQSGRYVYFKDHFDSEYWSLNWQPVKKDMDFYECRHGQGYSIIKSRYREIEHSLRVFAADDAPVELWTIKVKNLSGRKRALSVYPYVEWFLGSGTALWDNPIWYTRTEFHSDKGLISATFFNPSKVGETFTAFFKPLFKTGGACCSKREFCGFTGDIASPEAIKADKLDCPLAHGETGTGIFETQLTLEADESCELNLILGYQENEEQRDKLITRFSSPGAVEKAFNDVRNFWDGIIKKHQISTPDKEFDRWINVWLKYQEYQCFRWAGLGEPNAPLMGYRDVLQHVLAMNLFAPETARSRILEALRYQYNTGRAVRQWSRKGQHDRRDYRDSPVWIIFALCSYLKETGDFNILEEQVPYLDDSGEASVMEHAEKAIEALYNDRGGHGLSHVGEGDWYDPLNKIGLQGRGESVWLSMAVVAALNDMGGLYKYLGQNPEADVCYKRAEEMTDCINEYGWDGEWYLQAYTDDGEKLGSSECEEGWIFANPQIWAVISGAATGERLKKCLESLDKHMRCIFGYPIVYPLYTLKSACYGNAGLIQGKSLSYSHVAAFKMFADCLRNDGDAALETFKLIDPTNPLHPPEKTIADPHIIPNGYKGLNANPDEGYVLRSGSSGTFPWILKTAVEYMLGARADYGGLQISPCLPKDWERVSICREFRDTVYNIEIRNMNRVSAKHMELTVDGKIYGSSLITPDPAFRERKVICRSWFDNRKTGTHARYLSRNSDNN